MDLLAWVNSQLSIDQAKRLSKMALKRRFMEFFSEKDIRHKYFFLLFLGLQKFYRRSSAGAFSSGLFRPHHLASETIGLLN